MIGSQNGSMKSGRDGGPVDRADVVIVGFGIAGMTAAREAHRMTPQASIAIVSAQNHPTIYYPALKQFLMGRLGREQLVAIPPDMERIQQIAVLRATVEQVATREKRVQLIGGRSISYDSLLLATGRRSRELPETLPGSDFDGVTTAYSLTDYFDLRRRLAEASDVVVVGGGIHGLETVMAVLHHRLRITWLMRSPTCLPDYLDGTASALVLDRVRQAGVKILTETEVAEILGRVGAVSGVVTSRGQVIAAQLVITCLGTLPNIALAEQSDRPLRVEPDEGFLVDDWLRTSEASIYAAGSVAALPDRLLGHAAVRSQWADAEQQGAVAAARLVGREGTSRPPLGASWVTTSIGKLSLVAIGDTLGRMPGASTWTDSRSKGIYRRVTLAKERVVGYLSLGPTTPDPLAIKYVIDEGLALSAISAILQGADGGGRRATASRVERAASPPASSAISPGPLSRAADVALPGGLGNFAREGES